MVLGVGCAQSPPSLEPAALSPPAAATAPLQAATKPPPAAPRVDLTPKPAPDPTELLGAGPNDVKTRLGRPAHVWREAPGAMWQYVTDACVLSIYLHAAESGLKVIAVQARDRRDGRPAEASCYAGFVDGST
jgi:hypothetical protein